MAIMKKVEGKNVTLEFTSIGSLIDYIKEAKINDCYKEVGKLDSIKPGSWSGTETWEEAMKYLEFGWTTKSERLTTKLKLAKQNAPTMARRKTTPSVVGYTPIVPNYLMGIPLNMLDSKITNIKQKVVTLNKDISYNGGYSENSIEDNSVKAFQIVNALEANGVRCNLNIMLGVDGNYHTKNLDKLIVKVRVKNANQKMNISKASFPMVNPAMLRRIMFRVIETLPELKEEDRQIIYTYGRPVKSEDMKMLSESAKQYYISRDIRNAEEYANKFLK